MREFWHWDSLLSQCQFDTGQHDIFLALDPSLSQYRFDTGQHELILALGFIIVPMSVRYWTT